MSNLKNKSQTYDCIGVGNNICDKFNNIEECLWDGGDCCASTCLKTCDSKNFTGNECRCGSSFYDCKSNNLDCVKCIHGSCTKEADKCYKNKTSILGGIYGCLLKSETFGNTNTTDFYCGKDPFKNLTHFGNNLGYHFPGCGFSSINCTEIPCCNMVKLNGDTPENCDDTVNQRFVYDPLKKTIVLNQTSCLDYYSQCFAQNSLGGGRGQCCECEKGWAGIYCDIPLCEDCKYGTCVYKDTCKCDGDYEGEYCDEPICDKCTNGVCVSPYNCECYYGYTGNSCDQAVKTPFCINGMSDDNDNCKCFSGWNGKLCEIKLCDNCTNGVCRDDGSCSCNVFYKTTDENSGNNCDSIVSCEVFSPFCETCNNSTCTKCYDGYFLSDWDNTCKPSTLYDQYCVVSNSTNCLSCDYPFHLIDNKCVSYGMIEIASPFYSVYETEHQIRLQIRRYYGSYGNCIIYHEIHPGFSPDDYNYNPLNKMQSSRGIINLMEGEAFKEIILFLYSDSIFDMNINQFYFKIFNVAGGCYLGKIDTAVIEVFENETYFYDPSLLRAYINSTPADDNGEYNIWAAKTPFLDIEIYLEKINNNTIGNQIFTYKLSRLYTKEIENLEFLSSYNNLYSIKIPYSKLKYPSNYIGKKIITIYNCMNGFKMKFHNSAGFKLDELDQPYFIRNVDSIYIGNDLSLLTYFSVEWIFIYKNSYFNDIEISIVILLPHDDKIMLLINHIKINLVKKTQITEEECFSHKHCSKYEFSKFVLNSGSIIEVKIKLIHLKEKAYIFPYLIPSTGNQTLFDYSNSLSCEDLNQEPFVLNIK